MTPIGDFELRPDLMAAGEDHSCAIKDDGTVRCWGEGANGRLGYGGSADKNSPTATSSLGTGRTAVDITAGGDHTCAVLDDGSVKCWGGNAFGQLGDGTTTSRTSPTQTLSLGRPAVAVEAGMYFTCALLDNGSVACWGKNNQGQLGRGYTNSTTDLSQRTPGLRFQCRVAVQLSQWTSATTWRVVCWTTAALLAGLSTAVDKHRHLGTTSVAQILPRMLPLAVILPVA